MLSDSFTIPDGRSRLIWPEPSWKGTACSCVSFKWAKMGSNSEFIPAFSKVWRGFLLFCYGFRLIWHFQL